MPGSMKKGNNKPPKTPAANAQAQNGGLEGGDEELHAPKQLLPWENECDAWMGEKGIRKVRHAASPPYTFAQSTSRQTCPRDTLGRAL